MARFLSEGNSITSREADVVGILSHQVEAQTRVQTQTITKFDLLDLESSLESKIDAVLKNLINSIEYQVFEETCKTQANLYKRKHDDRDHDHHEGEKRVKLVETSRIQTKEREEEVQFEEGNKETQGGESMKDDEGVFENEEILVVVNAKPTVENVGFLWVSSDQTDSRILSELSNLADQFTWLLENRSTNDRPANVPLVGLNENSNDKTGIQPGGGGRPLAAARENASQPLVDFWVGQKYLVWPLAVARGKPSRLLGRLIFQGQYCFGPNFFVIAPSLLPKEPLGLTREQVESMMWERGFGLSREQYISQVEKERLTSELLSMVQPTELMNETTDRAITLCLGYIARRGGRCTDMLRGKERKREQSWLRRRPIRPRKSKSSSQMWEVKEFPVARSASDNT
ncbi:LOW QUALITY PROTEIN: hypothetical protein OSB04_028349 [Centaurea solstitialis]|uniref:Uncharacterized protein n=1 Tax=Centaurea solstitialis TaxID=347529 RepID=A0AA38SGB2_9ASTR|nr:LOW QUALITY PROTEIN: hypothetical protein OSB04_028349 [Centaurea solstitialis]